MLWLILSHVNGDLQVELINFLNVFAIIQLLSCIISTCKNMINYKICACNVSRHLEGKNRSILYILCNYAIKSKLTRI